MSILFSKETILTSDLLEKDAESRTLKKVIEKNLVKHNKTIKIDYRNDALGDVESTYASIEKLKKYLNYENKK